MSIVGGRRAPAGRGNRTCVCQHGPGVHPPSGPCELHTFCGCPGWAAADDPPIGDHRCQRSDDAEAAHRNLVLFGHLSGQSRALLGYSTTARIQAFRLSGDEWAAQDLEFALARRAHHDSKIVQVPSPRRPHPSEKRDPSGRWTR